MTRRATMALAKLATYVAADPYLADVFRAALDQPDGQQPDRWWVSQREAARLLGVTPTTVRKMLDMGTLHPVKLADRQVVRVAEIVALKGGDR